MEKKILENENIEYFEERPLVELPALGVAAISFVAFCIGLSLLIFPWYISVSVFVGIALCIAIFFRLYVGILVFLFGAFFHPSFWLPQLAVIRPATTLAVLVLFVGAIHAVIYQDVKIVKAPQNFLLIGYFGMALLASFKWPDLSLPYFLELAPKAIILYFAIVNIIKTRNETILLTWVLCCITLTLSLIGIYQYFHGIGLQQGSMLRLKGLSYDPNYFAFELIVPLPVILSLFFYYKNFNMRVLLATFAVFIISGIALTYSRGGFVMLVCVLLFTIGSRFGKRSNILVSGIFVLIFFFILILFIPSIYWERVLSILDLSDPAISERLVAAQAGIDMALKNPLIGVGWGLSHWEFLKESFSSGNLPHKLLNAHNTFILTAAEIGFGGLTFFLLLFVWSFKCLKEARKKFMEKKDFLLADIATGFRISLIIYLVGGMFISYNQLLQFWLIVPIAVVLKKISNEQNYTGI